MDRKIILHEEKTEVVVSIEGMTGEFRLEEKIHYGADDIVRKVNVIRFAVAPDMRKRACKMEITTA